MKKTIFILLILSTLLTLLNCKSEDVLAPNRTVYVAGYHIVGGLNRAVYWVNGVMNDLHVATGASESGAKGIFIEGNDIYVSGYYWNSGVRKACYWKNGVMINLHLASWTSSDSGGIYVENGKVYVAGWYNDGMDKACYFTDFGVPSAYTLHDPSCTSPGTEYSKAYSIAVNNGDVHVWGTAYNNPYSDVPCYWLNTWNSATFFSGYNPAGINGITLSGSTPYFAGSKHNGTVWEAVYWRENNSNLTKLSTNVFSHGKSIKVYNGSVYVSGNYGSSPQKAAYWINGSVTETHPAGSSHSEAIGLDVLDNDVYTSGYRDNGGNNEACYWKNGILNNLHPAGSEKSYAYSLSVK